MLRGLGLSLACAIAWASTTFAQEQTTVLFKQGCRSYVTGGTDQNAFFCMGAVMEAMELVIIVADHPRIHKHNICLPPHTGLLTGDFAKLIDQKSYLIKNDEPVIIGILNVLADTYPCKR